MCKHRKQYGVIPFIREGDKLRLVLITSRTNGFWIFPKGNLIKNKDKYESAAVEAFEEAGVRGKVLKDTCYKADVLYKDNKGKLELYAMEVTTLLDKWPEDHERKRRILTPQKAEKMIVLDCFKKCLRHWCKEFD